MRSVKLTWNLKEVPSKIAILFAGASEVPRQFSVSGYGPEAMETLLVRVVLDL